MCRTASLRETLQRIRHDDGPDYWWTFLPREYRSPLPPLSFVGEQGLTVGDGIHYGLGDWGKSGEAYRIMRLDMQRTNQVLPLGRSEAVLARCLLFCCVLTCAEQSRLEDAVIRERAQHPLEVKREAK